MEVNLSCKTLTEATSTAWNIMSEHKHLFLIIVHHTPTNAYYVLDKDTWLSTYCEHPAKSGTPHFWGRLQDLRDIALGIPLDIENYTQDQK